MPRPRPSAPSILLPCAGLAALVAVAVIAPPPPAAGAPRKGKVVRVERSKAGGKGTMRFCYGVYAGQNMTSCYGKPPVPGEVGIVYDEAAEVARVVVTKVEPFRDGQGNEWQWNIQYEVQRGDLSQIRSGAILTFDWPARATSRFASYATWGQVPPAGIDPGEQYQVGIDDDGDQIAESLATFFSCDSNGAIVGGGQAYYGVAGGHYCVAYYVRRGGGYDRARLDIVPYCGC